MVATVEDFNTESEEVFLMSATTGKIYKVDFDYERMVQQVQYEESIRQGIMQELMPNASTEVCFKAVTVDVPKDFPSALRHPRWGNLQGHN